MGSFPHETPNAVPVCPGPQRHTALGGGSDLVLEAVGVIAHVVGWLLSQGHGFKDAPL